MNTNPSDAEPNPFRRVLPAIARILLGLIFFVFGLNGFLHFIPQPKDAISPEAMGFFGELMKTGYMIPLIFATQTLGGALLLLNRFVPLALALLAPVIGNIICFHLFLAPSGLPLASFVLLLELYLAWSYRKCYRPMLAFRVRPGADPNPGGPGQ